MSGPWDAITAGCSATLLICAYLSWFVRVTVRLENQKQLKEINGTYVKSMGSNLTGTEIGHRLEALERRPGHGKAAVV